MTFLPSRRSRGIEAVDEDGFTRRQPVTPPAIADAKPNETITIEDTLVHVFFHRDGFLIGKLQSGIAIKGAMLDPQPGFRYTFRGKVVTHPKYGKQLAFDTYSTNLPTTPTAIREYIDIHAKWVGPAVARAIVERYQEKTLDVLKNNPEEVAATISGITLERANEISANLKRNAENERIEIGAREALCEVVIPRRSMTTILKRYGADAAKIIQTKPYKLARDVEGISFFIADRIARKNGIAKDSDQRILAAIHHVLEESANGDGHTYLPKSDLVAEARTILTLKRPEIEAVLFKHAIEETDEAIDAEASPGALDDVEFEMTDDIDEMSDISTNVEHTEVALRRLRRAERNVARRLVELNQAVEPIVPDDFGGLADDQIEGLKLALTNGVFILSGSPGTGKTTLIGKLIDHFDSSRTALAAPSGKAARRISELTGRPAYTIHVLLEAVPGGPDGGFMFTRNRYNPLDVDVVIIDETSMVSIDLMSALVNAIRPGTRLILIGDPYQLPSVGAGNVLKDLIASQVIPAVELTTIKRQNPGLIIRACAAIKNGDDLALETHVAFERDLHFIKASDIVEAQREILDAVQTYSQATKDPLRNIQVLTALREKTELSVKSLNLMLRDNLNAANKPHYGHLAPKLKENQQEFWLGDKIIQRKNDYELGIMNGDIGYVADIDTKNSQIVAKFDDPPRIVRVPIVDNRLELAYAITVHSFQGSQAQVIVLAAHSCLGIMVPTRPWLYTAISRAQRMCIIVGEREALTAMVRRNTSARRWTKLKRFVQGYFALDQARLAAEQEEKLVNESRTSEGVTLDGEAIDPFVECAATDIDIDGEADSIREQILFITDPDTEWEDAVDVS